LKADKIRDESLDDGPAALKDLLDKANAQVNRISADLSSASSSLAATFRWGKKIRKLLNTYCKSF
jgi:hypothetical protein